MRAYEFLTIVKKSPLILKESDSRNTLRKLKDLIEHPKTEDTIKAVARTKLEKLLSELDEEDRDQYIPRRIKIPTNLTEEDLDLPFSTKNTFGDIYLNLSNLRPAPNSIQFLRPASIHMFVPPPFCGISRAEYYQRIAKAVTNVMKINSQYKEGSGYHLVLSFF